MPSTKVTLADARKLFELSGWRVPRTLNQSIVAQAARMKLREDDPDEFLKQSRAKKIGRQSARGNQLYSLVYRYPLFEPDYFDDGQFHEKTEYYLRYTCPSTGKIYVSGVYRNCANSADQAMAWKLHLTKKEYLEELKIET